MIETHSDRLARRMRNVGVVAGFVLVIVGVVMAIHFLYQPLDVLSVRVMRQLGV
jgi:hypothetical protein